MLIVDKLALQEKLSEGEKTLAAYILVHGMEIAKYSTRSLAEVTYTSPPTVLRLCKKLGFSGFDDFKQNFMRELEYLDQRRTSGSCTRKPSGTPCSFSGMKICTKPCCFLNTTKKSTFFPPELLSIRPSPSGKRC